MFKIFEHAKKASEKAAANRKKRYDYRVKKRNYKQGDLVMLKAMQFGSNVFRKWAKKYTGPYVITQQTGPVNYRIKDSAKKREFVVHVDRLKPANNVFVRRVKILQDNGSLIRLGKGTVCSMGEWIYDQSATAGDKQQHDLPVGEQLIDGPSSQPPGGPTGRLQENPQTKPMAQTQATQPSVGDACLAREA
jgi:hypothetical protein